MSFSEFQEIKREFFSYRNGVTADLLRKGGSPFKIIFGLTIAQLSAIAKRMGVNKELSVQLWKNNSTRCSMLLAPMIMPVDNFSYEEALAWCRESPSTEVADILCQKLLVNQDYSFVLLNKLIYGNDMERYISLRLALYCLRNGIEVDEIKKLIRDTDILGKGRYGYLEYQVLEMM